MTGIPLLVAFVVLLVILAIAFSSVGRNLSAFFRLRAAGITARDALFLRKVAKTAGVADFSALVHSSAALDKCTAELLQRAKARGTMRNKRTQDLLSALYELRRKMDLDESRKRGGLTTTHYLKVGQPLRIVYPGAGTFVTKVIENTQSYLLVDLPSLPSSSTSANINWESKQLKVFFHRTDDAEYVFFTNAIPLDASDIRAVLQLRHSDKITRFQMRQNTRIKCSIPARLYLLGIHDSASEMESEPGIECTLKDLSGTGAMIQAGIELTRGAKIKIQFMIQDEMIVMSGTAKEVNYDSEQETSIINFCCNLIKPEMKNTVLAFVYNVLPKDEPINDADIITDVDENALT